MSECELVSEREREQMSVGCISPPHSRPDVCVCVCACVCVCVCVCARFLV